jgi:hypothetical protein
MAIVNIFTTSDADFYRGFAYQQLTGVPIDLTGNKMHMGIRKHAEDVTEFLLLTTENGGIIITDALNGKFTVWIKQDQLVRLSPDSYVHSLIRDTGTLLLEMWSGSLTHEAGPSR